MFEAGRIAGASVACQALVESHTDEFGLSKLRWSAKCRSQSRRRPTAEDDRDLMNMKTRWFVRGMLVGIALMLALNFVLTR